LNPFDVFAHFTLRAMDISVLCLEWGTAWSSDLHTVFGSWVSSLLTPLCLSDTRASPLPFFDAQEGQCLAGDNADMLITLCLLSEGSTLGVYEQMGCSSQLTLNVRST
jgi:hypothetical protein